ARLLEEGELQTPALGRPSKTLRLATERAQVLGVVIDRNRCRVVPAGLDGRLQEDQVHTFSTPKTYEAIIETTTDHARQLMSRRGMTTLGIGLSLPGLVDRRQGRAVFSPNLHQTDGRRPT